METNMLRAIIFFTAGLISIIFSKKLLKIQNVITKKLNIKYRDTEKSLIIVGIGFLIISVIFLVIAKTN